MNLLQPSALWDGSRASGSNVKYMHFSLLSATAGLEKVSSRNQTHSHKILIDLLTQYFNLESSH